MEWQVEVVRVPDYGRGKEINIWLSVGTEKYRVGSRCYDDDDNRRLWNIQAEWLRESLRKIASGEATERIEQ